MALDRNAFIENYLFELRENIDLIDSVILVLKKDPGNEEELNRLLRYLHTIKGSSRMLKFYNIEKIAHGLETVFKGVKEKRYGISKPLIQLVFISTNYLRLGADKIASVKEDSFEIKNILTTYEKAYANDPFSLDDLAINAGQAAVEGQKEGNRDISVAQKGAVDKGIKTFSSTEETIRIKVNKIDDIIKNINNLIIRQFQFKKENHALTELEKKFNDLLILSQNRRSTKDYDKLHAECLKEIQMIRKNFLETLPLLERNTFEVQEEILGLRMLPLELVMGTMGKMIEETAIQTGKEIDFEISGTDILIDKVILEKIHDPIVHIVRNAVDHGIELPEERQKKGKPGVGKIIIKCSSENGNIIIQITDDGQGIDYEKIRKKAIALNPHIQEEIMHMDETALNAFLFQPGFSTNDTVSQLSGRGVGLDIVRYNIEKVKGKIVLNSRKDEGSQFVLMLPLSMATLDGFFVESAGEKFLIPSNFVKELLIINEDEKLDLLNKKAIRLRDRLISVYDLSDILNKDIRGQSSKLYVLITENFGEVTGIIVNSIIQFSSLVYKPLPKNLNKLKVIQGIVFDESFNIVNILYVPEIVKLLKGTRNIDSRKKYSVDSREYKHVLVVDDSYSTREIEKSILELENYNVETANDGIEGLEKAKERFFNLVVTDIYMPRMDGITFIENLRKDKKYNNVPIIVVSSADNKELKEKLKKSGTVSFIIKSDFDRGNLVEEVKKLIG